MNEASPMIPFGLCRLRTPLGDEMHNDVSTVSKTASRIPTNRAQPTTFGFLAYGVLKPSVSGKL